jgi:hypothetical protein
MAASIVYTFRARCGGGGHTILGVSFNGVALGDFAYTTDELLRPIAQLTQEERQAAALLILKLRCQGLNRSQAVTLFGSPVTVTIQP